MRLCAKLCRGTLRLFERPCHGSANHLRQGYSGHDARALRTVTARLKPGTTYGHGPADHHRQGYGGQEAGRYDDRDPAYGVAMAGAVAGRSWRTSFSTIPSRRWRMRWAYAATSASCVTSTMVLPASWSRAKRLMISAPVLESRFPVGSTARRIDGLLT